LLPEFKPEEVMHLEMFYGALGFVIMMIAIQYCRFRRSSIDRIIKSVNEVKITKPLNITVSSWIRSFSFSFTIQPKAWRTAIPTVPFICRLRDATDAISIWRFHRLGSAKD
jgi:hypothetical protein